MLTVDFRRFEVRPGERVLDMGCGGGRHTYEAYRRGARVVGLDLNEAELRDVDEMLEALAPEAPPGATAAVVRGSAYDLPFGDATFDKVVAAEVLEHLPDDERAIAELVRVLRPGGLLAVTVPRWLPERICWALSDEYHGNEGGHVRIYRGSALRSKLRGLELRGRHHAHALHTPYWWLKCAVGVSDDDHPLPSAWHRLLVWDMTHAPWPTRLAERLLDPLIGKSLVLYLRKPATEQATPPGVRAATAGG